jgi:ABC-type dipeptide/oligopeptide/nickel transport system permease subunit
MGPAIVQVRPGRDGDAQLDARPASSAGSRTWAVMRADPNFWIGATIVVVVIAAALLAPLLAPHDPDHQYRAQGLTPAGDPLGPGGAYPLGTDRTGRDYLSRLLFGARTSLAIALTATALATVIGVVLGAAAGFWPTARLRIPFTRRRISVPLETLLTRLMDLALSFPILLLAIALAAVVKPSAALVIFVIVSVQWAAVARIVYGKMVTLRDAQFVEAARAAGIGGPRILRKQLLPHTMPLAVVYGSLGIASAVLFETTLSFLGAGVPGPTASWGGMIADHISWYATDPRLVLIPGIAVMVTVVGFMLLGDALRDALDPRAWSGARR